MNRKNTSRVFDIVASDHVRPDLNLLPGILARIEERNRPPMKQSLRYALVFLLVVLLAAVGLLARPGNVTAMKRLLGFLPQAGVVDLIAPLRVLAEPASQTRDGVTVSVRAAILSADKTVVSFTVENVPWASISHNETVGGCSGQVELRLPDGTIRQAISGQGSGNMMSLIYPSIPGSVNEAVFVMPCIRETLPGKAPENWELPLRFMLAPQVTAAPVIDLPTATMPSVTDTPSSGFSTPTAQSMTPDTVFLGIQVMLDRYIPLEDGYYLIGHTTWTDKRIDSMGWMGWGLKAYDAAGQELPMEPAMGSLMYGQENIPDTQPGQWVYHLYGKTFASPVTLRATAMEVHFKSPIQFELDLSGNNIQPADLRAGASWQIEPFPLEVLGIQARVNGISFLQVGDMKGFEFHVLADPPLRSLFLQINYDQAGNSSGGTRVGEQPGEFSSVTLTDQALVYPLKVTTAFGSIDGIWQTTWTPPEGDPNSTPTAVPHACLTLDGWKEALQNHAPLPPGLPSQVLLSRSAEAPAPSMFLSALNGSEEQGLVYGDASLTQDGRKLVYGGPNNLFYVLDLQTKELTTLVVSAQDYRPKWSPDGRSIAFNRYGDSAGIYVIDAGGSNLRPVVQTESGMNPPELSGWSPDGAKILYSARSVENNLESIRLVDITTGIETDLFQTRLDGASPVISPDGQWIAYLDKVIGKNAPGLYVSKLDGTERRLMVQLDHWSVGGPQWSPDGQWLAIIVVDTDQFTFSSTPALLQVHTCQIAPLPQLNGAIQSWVIR